MRVSWPAGAFLCKRHLLKVTREMSSLKQNGLHGRSQGRVGGGRRVGVEYHKHKPYEPEAAARSASWILRGAQDPQETPAAAASESSSGIVSGSSSHPPSCARAAGVGAMRGRHSSLKSRSSLSSRSPTKCGYQSKILDNTSAVATDRLSDDVKPRKGK